MIKRYRKKLELIFLVLALLVVMSSQGLAAHQYQDYATVDVFISSQMQSLDIPGLALGIVRGDQVVYLKGYGVADDFGRTMTPQTPFLVASLSKPITALAVMQLAEEGKIDLDQPVQDYLPWFQTADVEKSSLITIRDLLHQTSGFSEFGGYQRNLDPDISAEALESSVRALRDEKLNSFPGEKFEYSNTNYDVLGLLVQTVSGISYEAYIEERIFAPLKMQNSYTSLEKARSGGVSSGYISFFGRSVNYDRFMPNGRAVVPSAGLFSSAEDMAYLLRAHMNDGQTPDGQSILSPEGINELHQPGVAISKNVHYAMGWVIFPFEQMAAASSNGTQGPITLSHGGSWANFRALVLMVPEQELGIVVLFNKSDIRNEAEYENIVWNTALLVSGLELFDFPGSQGFLTKYGHLAGVGLLILLAASFIWSLRVLLRGLSSKNQYPSRKQTLFLWILLFFDLVLTAYILIVELRQSNSSLPLALAFNPEVGLIYSAILAFTLGWGIVRTVLLVLLALKSKKSLLPSG